jgi:hypothetical protein
MKVIPGVLKKLLLMAFCLFGLSGCASIVSGVNQIVSVEARDDRGVGITGAACKLTNNKGSWFVTTPGSTIVNRSMEDLAVRCEKENINIGLTSAKSITKGMAFGNILFGGVIGAGVDVASGAAFDYPQIITVTMRRLTEPGTPMQPGPDAASSGIHGTGGLPFETERMRAGYADYNNKVWSKAFAISTHGGFGRAWGHRSIAAAKESAIDFCEQRSPKGSCFIYSVNNDVVWDRQLPTVMPAAAAPGTPAVPMSHQPTTVQVASPTAPAAALAPPAPRAFRPAACEWPGVKQGVGAC